MTRYSTLLNIYSHLDSIYLGLILIAVWVAGTGHLLDWMTRNKWKMIVPIYWTIVLVLYVGGMVFVGLSFS